MTNSPTETTLQFKRTLSATREKVFRAWTEPAEMKKWFAPSDEFSVPFAEVDLRVGGQYRIGMKPPEGNEVYIATGTYREVHPPDKLVFTWGWEGPNWYETRVTIELRAVGNSTELVLTHELFPSVEERDKHNHGWMGCVGRLEKLLS